MLNDAYGQAFSHLHLYGIRGIRNKCGVVTLSNEHRFWMAKTKYSLGVVMQYVLNFENRLGNNNCEYLFALCREKFPKKENKKPTNGSLCMYM